MTIRELVAKTEAGISSAKGKLWSGALIYGTLMVAYTSLFFFGALYPGYGMPAQSVVYEEDTENEVTVSDKEGHRTESKADNESGDEVSEDKKDVVFKSLFWEQLKEWF